MKKVWTIALMLLVGISFMGTAKTRVVYNVGPKMNCENCVGRVKKALGAIKGVQEVVPSLETQSVEIVYDENILKPEILVSSMAAAGYTLTPAAGECPRNTVVPALTVATEATVDPRAAAAAEMQCVEGANPGVVTAIDGKPVQAANCTHGCGGSDCDSHAVPQPTTTATCTQQSTEACQNPKVTTAVSCNKKVTAKNKKPVKAKKKK